MIIDISKKNKYNATLTYTFNKYTIDKLITIYSYEDNKDFKFDEKYDLTNI